MNQSLKLIEDSNVCFYSFSLKKEINEEEARAVAKNFREAGAKSENIKELPSSKEKREKECGCSVVRELCYINNDCFSIAIYLNENRIEFSCRKKAKKRFERFLISKGYSIENA